jgi:hypothetical protein
VKLVVQKKILVVSIIVIIVIISGIGIYFLSGNLSDNSSDESSNPPVDFSGINLASSLTERELLPEELMNEPLNMDNLVGGWMSGSGYGEVRTAAMEYNGVTVRVWKAETIDGAKEAFEEYYSDAAFSEYFDKYVMEENPMPSWFTFEDDGINGFVWVSDIWVFGVEAGDAQTRNQAASEWIQKLRDQ